MATTKLHWLTLATLACLLAVATAQSQGTDKTLTSSGSNCIDRFNETAAEYYATNMTECTELLRTALTLKGGSECPETTPGSEVHACLTMSEEAKEDWEGFFQNCEVLNIADRKEQGEAEADNVEQDSCFDKYDDWGAFESYLDGGGEEGMMEEGSGDENGAGAAQRTPLLLSALAATLGLTAAVVL